MLDDLLQIGAKSWTRWETGQQRPSRSLNLLLRALYDGAISPQQLLSLGANHHDWTAQFVSLAGTGGRAAEPVALDRYLQPGTADATRTVA